MKEWEDIALFAAIKEGDKEALFSRFAGNAGYDAHSGTYYGMFCFISPDAGGQAGRVGRIIEVDAAANLVFEAKLTAPDLNRMFYQTAKIDLNKVINDKD